MKVVFQNKKTVETPNRIKFNSIKFNLNNKTYKKMIHFIYFGKTELDQFFLK